MSFFITALVFVLIFSFLIWIHECGHFFTAKRSGVKVEEFGMGLPPRIWGVKKGETLYSINAIPFGGFVRMLGEDSTDKKALKDKRSFASQSLSKRALIVSAGVIMNLLVAFVLLTFGFLIGMEPLLADENDYFEALRDGQIVVDYQPERTEEVAFLPRFQVYENTGALDLAVGDRLLELDGQSFFRVQDLDFDQATDLALVSREGQVFDSSIEIAGAPMELPRVVITGVMEASPAEQVGLQPGDEILSVNSKPVDSPADVIAVTRNFDGDLLAYDVLRAGAFESFDVPLNEDGLVGVSLSELWKWGEDLTLAMSLEAHELVEVKKLQYGLLSPFIATKEMFRLGDITVRTFVSVFVDFLTFSPLPENVSGPVGIAQMTALSLQEGFSAVIRLVALLSLSLGVINIFPFPALDGGRLAFIIVEALTGKKPSPRVEASIHSVGFVLLLLFIATVTFNDIMRAL